MLTLSKARALAKEAGMSVEEFTEYSDAWVFYPEKSKNPNQDVVVMKNTGKLTTMGDYMLSRVGKK